MTLWNWKEANIQALLLSWSVTGITNHEEYSLVRELPEDEKEKMLTLKRDKTIAKDQKKLEEMKKKLHTDDESRSHFVDG